MKLYLASLSPRRQALLQQAGIAFERVDASIDESRWPEESLRACVLRLATAKARAGAAVIIKTGRPPGWVLGADTVVTDGSRLLGKPESREQAGRMLMALQDRTHEVWTAFACARVPEGDVPEAAGPELVVSRVTFGSWTDSELGRWLDQNEWSDKAGGYAIQGMGAAFVARLEGSYSGVVGLPLYELRQMLTRLEGVL